MQNHVMAALLRGESTEVAQFFSRVPGLTPAYKNAYRTLINGLVRDGLWSLLSALYILAAQTSFVARQNLRSGNYTLAVIGSPTFTAGQGYTGDASAAALNTGLTPGAGTRVLSNDNHIGVYCLTSRTTGQTYIQMGSIHDPSGDGLHIFPKHTDNNTYYANQGVDNAHALSANASGHYINTRTSSTLVTLWRNGASFNTDTGTASSNIPNTPIYILAYRNATGVFFPSGDKLSAAHIGGGLTSTQAANLSSRINAYMTALGVNTY